jgi:hypothetical protein
MHPAPKSGAKRRLIGLDPPELTRPSPWRGRLCFSGRGLTLTAYKPQTPQRPDPDLVGTPSFHDRVRTRALERLAKCILTQIGRRWSRRHTTVSMTNSSNRCPLLGETQTANTPSEFFPLLTDAVEKGFCGSFRATLIQARSHARNIDSRRCSVRFYYCVLAWPRGLFRQHRPVSDVQLHPTEVRPNPILSPYQSARSRRYDAVILGTPEKSLQFAHFRVHPGNPG